MWWIVRMWMLNFLIWLTEPPADNICFENCSDKENCEECGWWRAIA